MTGRAEADFEGNFSRADNRNVSSYRSSMLSLRLAYARLDYDASDNTDIFFEGGQDWMIYGSSLLGNLLETTFFGAYFGQTTNVRPRCVLASRRSWQARAISSFLRSCDHDAARGARPAACPAPTKL